MINFDLSLRNPFSDRWKHVFAKSGMFGKHKAWEAELIKDSSIIGVGFRFTTHQDHAGMMLDLSLLGHNLILQYYDTRHWNDDEGRYYNYDKAGNAT